MKTEDLVSAMIALTCIVIILATSIMCRAWVFVVVFGVVLLGIASSVTYKLLK